MKVAFVSGPYRSDTIHGIIKNIRNAESVAIELWKMGFAVICPHKNTELFDGICPDKVWLEGALELLRRSDIVVLAPGWEDSSGTGAEIAEAMFSGSMKPIYKWPEHRQELIALDKG